MKQKLQQDTIDAILVFVLQEKMTASQTAILLGLHRDTVRKVLYNYGYHKIDGKWVPDSKES